MPEWTLRDMDNRDDSGEPWEITAPPADLVGYLDVLVRGDLTYDMGADALENLIDACEIGDLDTAKSIGPQLSIYIRKAGDEYE